MPPRKPKSKAPPHPDEARKAELEVKMRSGGLVSSELEELQRIRKRIDDAAAEVDAERISVREATARADGGGRARTGRPPAARGEGPRDHG